MELQAPIVPVPDSSALQYVAKGLSGMMANRRYQQQYELAYQKMVQDAALDQEKFKLAREQVANQFEVQQAQIDNYHAEAKQHNAMAKYTSEVRGQTAKDNQELLGRVTEYNRKAAEVMNGKWGTTDGNNQLGLLDGEYADIANIKQGWQSRNANATKQRREELNNISTLSTFRRNMDDTAAHGMGNWTRVPEIAATPDYLDYDPVKKEFRENNVWGINKESGDPYLTVQGQRDAKEQWLGWKIVPPSEASKAKDAKTVTFPKKLAESYIEQQNAFRTKATGLAGPPPSTVQAVQQQAQMGGGGDDLINVMSPDGHTTGKIPRANIQRALDQGYTTLP